MRAFNTTLSHNVAWFAVIAAFGLAACNKSEDERQTKKHEEALKPQAEETPKAAPAPAPELSAEEIAKIPTEEDFEDEADSVITLKSLEVEVDKLEQEIIGP
jgi:hypothetical protein